MAFDKEYQTLRKELRKQLKCYTMTALSRNMPECKTRREYEDKYYSALINKKLRVTTLTPPLDLLYLVTGTLSLNTRRSLLNHLSEEMLCYICTYYGLSYSHNTEEIKVMLSHYQSIPPLNVVNTYTCEQLKTLSRLYGCSLDKYSTTPEQMIQHYLLSINFVGHSYILYDQPVTSLTLDIPAVPLFSPLEEKKIAFVPPERGKFTIQRKESRFASQVKEM